jgi:prepilin-type N-terminal cleavage/methylation domain-containing protein
MWDRITEKRNEGGFTLIELLIVIIILAILAAIVVFAVGTTGQNATSAACSSDAKTFETALEDYKAEIGSYPAVGNGNTPPAGASYGLLGNVTPANPSGNWTYNGQTIGPFMRSLPTTTHYQIVTDGNGGVFVLPSTTNGGPALSSVTAATLDGTTGAVTVGNVSTTHTTDPEFINFDATNQPNQPSVCLDSNVAK